MGNIMAQLDVLAGRFAGSSALLRDFKRATVTEFGQTEIVLVRGNQQLTVSGNDFAQSADGDIIAGTVTGLARSERGILELTVGGLVIPATDFERFLNRGNVKAFESAAFGGDDVMNGGTNGDELEGAEGNDRLAGAGGSDLLDGGEGDDELDGGAGADRLRGGPGDDTYVVDDEGDRVEEAKNAGTDTVEASVTHVLDNNVEILRLTGTAAIDGTGGKGDNEIFGNAGANRLDGRAGDDVLDGGAGVDVLRGDKGADRFVVSTLEGGADRVDDFNVRQGDVLDLRELFSFASEDAASFIRLQGSGKTVEVLIDADGGANSFVPAVTVAGDLGLDLGTLVDQGVILYRTEG